MMMAATFFIKASAETFLRDLGDKQRWKGDRHLPRAIRPNFG
jgi:hypothetical protein